MYTRTHSPILVNDPMGMLARCHMQDLERDIERIRLAKLARAGRPHRTAALPALARWLRTHLPAGARAWPVGPSPVSSGELTAVGRR